MKTIKSAGGAINANENKLLDVAVHTPKNKMDYFWKKKDVAVYFLSVFVFFIHISSVSNYTPTENSIYRCSVLLQGFLREGVGRIAVPTFFMISGALFFRNYTDQQYVKKLTSRLKSLGIPYLIWNTIWLIFSIVTSYTFIANYFVGRQPFELSIVNVLNAIFHYGCNLPFWFVFELLFFVLISPVLNLLLKNKYIGITAIIILEALAVMKIGLPPPLFYSRNAIVFYLVGGLIGKHFFSTLSKVSSKQNQMISLVVLIVLCLMTYIFFKNQCAWFDYGIKDCVLILSGFMFWNAIDLFVPIMNGEFYTRSFAVFAMHLNVSAVIAKLIYLALPKTGAFAIINYVLTLVMTLAMINLFCVLLNRFFPGIYKTIMGNR